MTQLFLMELSVYFIGSTPALLHSILECEGRTSPSSNHYTSILKKELTRF